MRKYIWVFIVLLASCNSKKVYREVSRTDEIDPDIILINIGKTDRAEIASLLLDIEKCSPLLIGIDAIFSTHKTEFEDSILAIALKKIQFDIAGYNIEKSGEMKGSVMEFRRLFKAEGHLDLQKIDGISRHFTPIKEIEGQIFESFAVKIVRQWKPNLKFDLSPNKSIPILFQRTQSQFRILARENFHNENICELIKGKIILVGYLGPDNEDKHIIPVNSEDQTNKQNSDTYGVVIQANAIRTLLFHVK